MRLHFEQHRMLAGNVMAFEHIVEQGDGLLEESDRARMPDRNADKRRHVLAEFSRINGGVITGDDCAVLKLLDALDHRGRGETDLLGELRERDPAVLLENRDYLQIYSIGLESLVA